MLISGLDQARIYKSYLTILIQGDADYKLDGTIAAIFPLYGEGPMWLEIYGLDLYAKAGVLINAEGFIEVGHHC